MSWNNLSLPFESTHAFEHLKLLHEMTRHWVQLSKSPPCPLFSPLPALNPAVWEFGSLENVEVIDLLESPSVPACLKSVFESIQLLQIWTLHALLDTPQPCTAFSALENLTWKLGFQTAQHLQITDNGPVPQLAKLHNALKWVSPYWHPSYPELFIPTRATDRLLELNLTWCPHQLKTGASTHQLCQLYTRFSEGFGFALNPRFCLTQTREPFCSHKWEYLGCDA